MPPPATCFLCDCKPSDYPQRSFHRIPEKKRDKELKIKWLKAIGRTKIPRGGAKICSLHFRKECFSYALVSDTPRLIRGSLPTLHITCDSESLEHGKRSKKKSIVKSEESESWDGNHENYINYKKWFTPPEKDEPKIQKNKTEVKDSDESKHTYSEASDSDHDSKEPVKPLQNHNQNKVPKLENNSENSVNNSTVNTTVIRPNEPPQLNLTAFNGILPESNTSHGNNVFILPSGEEHAASKLEYLRKINNSLTLKNSTLHRQNRLALRKNELLEKELKELKRKMDLKECIHSESELNGLKTKQDLKDLGILGHMVERALLTKHRTTDEKPGFTCTKFYTRATQDFAIQLYIISPVAYEFTRKSFKNCLPHSASIRYWYGSKYGRDINDDILQKETDHPEECEETSENVKIEEVEMESETEMTESTLKSPEMEEAENVEDVIKEEPEFEEEPEMLEEYLEDEDDYNNIEIYPVKAEL